MIKAFNRIFLALILAFFTLGFVFPIMVDQRVTWFVGLAFVLLFGVVYICGRLVISASAELLKDGK